jgi:antitoxin component HigA of HigAB toxin-antitoxin module
VAKSSNGISSDEELDVAIQEISALVELGDNLSAEEYARVDELATMIEQYESVHFPMVQPVYEEYTIS